MSVKELECKTLGLPTILKKSNCYIIVIYTLQIFPLGELKSFSVYVSNDPTASHLSTDVIISLFPLNQDIETLCCFSLP